MGKGKDVLMLALDYDNVDSCVRAADLLSGHIAYIKLGLEFFVAQGPEGVRAVMNQANVRVFLDLKLHDIPNTVSRAVAAARDLNVDFITIHASGGAAMISAAVEAARGSKLKILAVTALTSLQDVSKEQVLDLASKAAELGVDGVVCSAHEAGVVRAHLGDKLIIVTPGIRMPTDSADDQGRVATPKFAISQGANFLVMGRSILCDEDPLAKVKSVEASIFA